MERYEKYKDSGVEWIGEIPEGWEVKKLKYVADANPSNIDKKSKDNEDAVLLCNYVDVYKNEFISSELNFMKATASKDQVTKFILEKGDLIITKDSETPDDIAAPALVAENFDNVVCGYHLTHIKPKNISGVYLFRYFQSKYLNSYFEVAANGVTRYGLGVDKINSALILNPPKPEQTAIANYLDRKTAEIDDLIAQKERLLELYEEEKNAIINQAVTKGIDPDVKLKDSGIDWLGEIPEGWEVKKLKYVIQSITGGGTPSTNNPEFWNGAIPWVSPKDMKVKLLKETKDYVTELAIKQSATNLISSDRVLIVVRSGILKHTLPVSINAVPVCLNQDMKAIKPNETINTEFFFWKLKGLESEIITTCSKMGATVDT